MESDRSEHTLSPQLAQEIATDLRASIGLHVLITNDEGIITGSGDPDRVGNLHDPSLDVMTTLEPHVTSAESTQGMDVKPGITWPIVISGKPFGTVGITGSPRTVRPFGLIVQRQIEILVRESELLRSRFIREQALRELVRDIAFFDSDNINSATLTSRAAELGVDLHRPRVAIIISANAPGQVSPTPRLIREVFNSPDDVVAEVSVGRAAVLHSPIANPVGACLRLVERTKSRHNTALSIGIGEVADSVPTLHESYYDASTAARLGPLVEPTMQIYPIGKLRLHQLIDASATRARSRFSQSLIGKLRESSSWDVARETLTVWVSSGFSLARAAEMLHIHRNTLIYRLDKLSKDCGHSVREPTTAIPLYLACLLDQIENK